MTTDEQLEILKPMLMDSITRCGDLRDRLCAANVEIAGLRERVWKVEQASPEWVRIGHTGCSWDWQCPDCKATMDNGCHHPSCSKAPPYDDSDELTGSIDGLDAELRVQVQTPEEHAWVKTQRWYKATQTPVPLWTTGGKNGTQGTA